MVQTTLYHSVLYHTKQSAECFVLLSHLLKQVISDPMQ